MTSDDAILTNNSSLVNFVSFSCSCLDLMSGSGDAKKAILQWARKVTEDYPNVKIDDLLKSWQDGLALAAIVHHYLPEEKKVLMPISDLKTDTKEHKLSNIKVHEFVGLQDHYNQLKI